MTKKAIEAGAREIRLQRLNTFEHQAEACIEAAIASGELVPTPRGPDTINSNRVKDAMDDGNGFWRSCSGCHEFNDGYPTGPHSSALRCCLGVGCFECGGIGAVWDNTDYSDYGSEGIGELVHASAVAAEREGCRE